MVFRLFLRQTYEQFINFTDYTCDFESDEFLTWITFLGSLELETDIKIEEQEARNYLLNTSRVSTVHDYQK